MIGYHLERNGGEGGGSFEIERPRSKGWKNFGSRWIRGVGGLKNLTIFSDVICVSSLIGVIRSV